MTFFLPVMFGLPPGTKFGVVDDAPPRPHVIRATGVNRLSRLRFFLWAARSAPRSCRLLAHSVAELAVARAREVARGPPSGRSEVTPAEASRRTIRPVEYS